MANIDYHKKTKKLEVFIIVRSKIKIFLMALYKYIEVRFYAF